jgi:putative oxidoreductase
MAEDLGKLLLRITLAGLMLFHGVAKITGSIDYIPRMLERHGLPTFITYGVYVGEVLAPVLVLLGWYSRVGSVLIVLHMTVIFTLAHAAQFFTLDRSGGWALELQGFYLMSALVLALLGPGKYGINRR